MVWGLWKLTELLEIKMISNIIGGFMNIGLIALIIVFQQEIRKFLLMLGSTNLANKRSYLKHFKFLKQDLQPLETDIKAVVAALEKMSQTKTGALLVFEKNNSLDFVRQSGDRMNIELSQPIIESIFYKTVHFTMEPLSFLTIRSKQPGLFFRLIMKKRFRLILDYGIEQR